MASHNCTMKIDSICQKGKGVMGPLELLELAIFVVQGGRDSQESQELFGAKDLGIWESRPLV